MDMWFMTSLRSNQLKKDQAGRQDARLLFSRPSHCLPSMLTGSLNEIVSHWPLPNESNLYQTVASFDRRSGWMAWSTRSIGAEFEQQRDMPVVVTERNIRFTDLWIRIHQQ
jgi:hypothetical protein